MVWGLGLGLGFRVALRSTGVLLALWLLVVAVLSANLLLKMNGRKECGWPKVFSSPPCWVSIATVDTRHPCWIPSTFKLVVYGSMTNRIRPCVIWDINSIAAPPSSSYLRFLLLQLKLSVKLLSASLQILRRRRTLNRS